MGTGSSKQRTISPVRGNKSQYGQANGHIGKTNGHIRNGVVNRCPVTGQTSFSSFTKLKNLADEGTIYTDTLHNRSIEPMTCSNGKCTGSILSCLGLKSPAVRPPAEVLRQAKDFFVQYYSYIKMENSPEHKNRMKEVENSINKTGSYFQTFEEIEWGAKMAWRNSPRCIGRIQWTNLKTFDRRNVKTPKQMFDAICEHVIYASNGGNLRSAISVFPQRTDAKHDFRIWNGQMIRYAGYRQEDGTIIGDPANVDFTEICQGLGWQGKNGMFDVLPMVIQANGEDPEMFEYPSEIILEVPLKHPNYPWFAEMGLKWYAVPGVANMMFDCGGIEYTASPFNGWYMGTEIGTRDLCDPQRYNIIELVGKKMGLDTRQVTNLWKDRVVVELNFAVLHSFQAQGVTISDHHTASESFMTFMKNEQKQRGGCPADWVWIVPPTSGSITPVFHQEMLLYKVKPAYEYMVDAWKTHVWKQSVPVQWLNRNKNLTFKVVAKAVRFAASLNVKALKKRTKCTILYATETGTAERFARVILKIFSYAFNVKMMCMDDYNTETMRKEELFILVTSTFGNGDPPDNGKSFSKVISTKRRLHRKGQANGVMANVRYAVFGLGSRAYPKFCSFAHFLDESLDELSAKRLYKCGEGDSLAGQEEALHEWALGAFKEACKFYRAGDTYNMTAATNSVNVIDRSWNSTRYRLCQALVQTEADINLSLSLLHARPVQSVKLLDTSNLQSKQSSRKTLLAKVDTKGERELKYLPGDHFSVFPANDPKIVSGVLHRLAYKPPNDELIIVEVLQKGTTTSRKPATWEYYSKIPPCRIRTALSRFFDLTTPPTQNFLKGLVLQEMNTEDKRKIENLINDTKAYEHWRDFNYPNFYEVLEQFPSVKLDPTFLFTQLPILQPRYYSISSSPNAHPREIHLTVAVVKYNTQGGKGPEHEGVCSGWLDKCSPGEMIPCFVRAANNFHLPDNPSEPVLMVGPGTGIAPLRSFWQHREADKRTPKEGRSKWQLYFGCRQDKLDNIYREELIHAKNSGALTDVYTALSREQGQPKKYVQDLMKQNGKDIYDLLVNKKGHFYICGEVEMAYGVTNTIMDIVMNYGNMDKDDAEDFIMELKDENRMHEDIFGATIKSAVGGDDKDKQNMGSLTHL